MKETLKQISNRNKIIAAAVLAIILCIVIFAIARYPRDMKNIFVDSSVETMQKNLSASAVYANESIEANYSDMLILQDMLKKRVGTTDTYDESVFSAMQTVKERSGFERIGIMRDDSDFLFATMSDGTRQQLDLWTLAQDVALDQISIEMQTSPFQTADGGHDAIVYRSHFLGTDGKGYMLIAEMSQDTLDKLLSVGQTTEGLSLVIRDNGNVVYDRGSLDDSAFVSYNLFAYLKSLGATDDEVNQLSEDIGNEQAGTADFTLNGTDCTFLFHRVENTGWVCVQGYSKEALAGSNLATVNSKTMHLVILVAALLIAVLASLAIIGIHRAKAEGQREALERERLFEEMSRHITSAIVILEDEKPEPRFLSYNFNDIVPSAPENFSPANIAEWLGYEKDAKLLAEHYERGRTELDIPNENHTLRIGIYAWVASAIMTTTL